MTQDEEQIIERNPNTNILSELPGRPYRLTMEVPLFLIMLALTLSGPVISNIMLYRTCVHSLHYDVEECKEFLAPEKSNTSIKLEEAVQKYTTYVSVAKTLVESIGPAILSFFLGVWSDTYGRKPLVVWPLFGASLSAMLTVIYATLENLGPWWLVLTVIPFSLTGGYAALFTGAFTYISDITSTDKRSIRMTILEAAFSAGNFIGSLVSSYLIKLIGNVFVLLVIATLNVLAYAFTNIFLVESLNGALKGGLSTLMDFQLVKEMISTCFKKRPNHGRAQLLLLTLSNTLAIFILYGAVGLSYMYTREKLHWAVQEYSIYSGIGTLINVAGALIGVKVGKMFGLADLPLSILGYISAICEFIVIAFATQTWHMYLGTAIASMKGLTTPLVRSYLTKVLPIEDIAKAFALLCAAEAICPLLSPILYNSLYRVTIDAFPGAIYILSAFLCLVCALMLCTVQYFNVKQSSSASYERVNEEES